MWIRCVWLGMRNGGGSCGRGDGPWGSTEVREFLGYLLKKNSAPVIVSYAMSNAINS
jgi:hypothetical protein